MRVGRAPDRKQPGFGICSSFSLPFVFAPGMDTRHLVLTIGICTTGYVLWIISWAMIFLVSRSGRLLLLFPQALLLLA